MKKAIVYGIIGGLIWALFSLVIESKKEINQLKGNINKLNELQKK